jgi:hypothetical protein
MLKLFYRLDDRIYLIEKKTGLFAASLIFGFLLLGIAALFSSPRFVTEFHGNGFTRLSVNPFDLESENDLRFRILSPLLGWLFFFRGPSFMYFMLLILGLFFSLVYYYRRKYEMRPSESIAITALLSFSSLAFYQFYFPAYNDPLTFLLVLLFIEFHRKKWSVFLITLMFFNHENVIFLFPFFFVLACEKNFSTEKLLSVSLSFIVATIPYLLFRYYLITVTNVEYNADYYFDAHNMKWTQEHVFPQLLYGIFQTFRLAWILPVIAFLVNLKEKRPIENILMASLFIFVISQMLIAYDISRLTGLCFPLIIISAMRLRKTFGPEKLLLLAHSIILLNFFIPAYCIGALEPIFYGPFWLK